MYSLPLAATLLGQTQSAAQNNAFLLAISVAVIVGAWMLGFYLAKAIRLPDYGWKLGLILFSVALSLLLFNPKRINWGVDLRGGVILVYEIDTEASRAAETEEITAAAKGNPDLIKNRDKARASEVVQALTERINPSGTKEIVVRPYGESQIEIIVPEVDEIEVKRIKEIIKTAGVLEFRIVANRGRQDHQELIALADDPAQRNSNFVKNGDKLLGRWCRAKRDDKPAGIRPFKTDVAEYIIRDAKTREPIVVPATARGENHAFEKYLQRQGIEEVDVLMFIADDFNVTGSHLRTASRGNDEQMAPCVRFSMKAGGADLFGGLTGANLPDKDRNFYQHLGIVLDGKLISAPRILSRISDQGQITGRFTQEEVDFIVGILRAGRLPATLNPNPISENQIGALLGEDTIRKGTGAIALSMVVVFGFVLVYYRFAGVVAAVALLINLLMTMAIMIAIKASLTLPGLAGLALTVGMSVDANVLIFERIREELGRGTALRMAIRNGFAKAFSAIFDSNVTTILTALILYGFGTDQLRGFAVTLILGILTSMYTAIFCARVAFEIYERKLRATDLKMLHIFGVTKFDFMGKWKPCATVSTLVIVGGLIACVARGNSLLDIDFSGGVAVVMRLDQPLKDSEVRSILAGAFEPLRVDGSKVQYSLNRVDVSNEARGLFWKIDCSLQEVKDLEELLAKHFKLAKHTMTVAKVETVDEKPVPPASESTQPDPAKEPSPAEKPAESPKPTNEPKPADQPAPEVKPAKEPADAPQPQDDKAKDDKPAEKKTDGAEKPADEKQPVDEKKPADATDKSSQLRGSVLNDGFAFVSFGDLQLAQADADPKPAADDKTNDNESKKPDGDTPKADAPAKGDETAKPEPAKPESPDAKTPAEPSVTIEEPQPVAPATAEKLPVVKSRAQLNFVHEISGRNLREEMESIAEKELNIVGAAITVANKDWNGEDNKLYAAWEVTLTATQADAQRILDRLHQKMNETPIFTSSSKFGSKVANRMKGTAVFALVASWLGLIIYVWVRFQNVAFGVAAVVALIHDVLVTLAALAVSYWVAVPLGFLMIDEFKINLTIIAAFLTIIGYSINDTIVIFDRVREIRGKSHTVTWDMLNLSLNQTLSRTILTSLTVFMTVFVLYVMGGEEIHGFAFAMLIGLISGTYSTVYVASPVLLWMVQAEERREAASKNKRLPARQAV